MIGITKGAPKSKAAINHRPGLDPPWIHELSCPPTQRLPKTAGNEPVGFHIKNSMSTSPRHRWKHVVNLTWRKTLWESLVNAVPTYNFYSDKSRGHSNIPRILGGMLLHITPLQTTFCKIPPSFQNQIKKTSTTSTRSISWESSNVWRHGTLATRPAASCLKPQDFGVVDCVAVFF